MQDSILIDDIRTMNAHKVGRQGRLDVIQRLTNDKVLSTHMNADIISCGFHPIDIGTINKSRASLFIADRETLIYNSRV